MSDDRWNVALVWRGDRTARDTATRDNHRLRPVFEALADLGIGAEPAVYCNEMVDEVRDQLLPLGGVLSCGSIPSEAARTAPSSMPCWWKWRHKGSGSVLIPTRSTRWAPKRCCTGPGA